MKKKKNILVFLAAVVILMGGIFVVRFLVGGNEDSWICDSGQWVRHGNPSSGKPSKPCGGTIVGGDRDEHGCIGSAGYSWCGNLNKCIRPWEETCVNIKSIKEETKLYKLSVEYPTFSDEGLNNEIEGDVNKMIADFKKQSTENWSERKQNDVATPDYPEQPFDLFISWTSQQMNSKYVSFKLSMDYFTGGANFAQEIKTYNYDMVNKKPVMLAELFKNSDYLARVADFAKKDLTSQGLTDMFEEGISAKPENFKNFTFDDNTITFYFPKYQVAPGAYGEQKVVMGRNEKN